MSLETKYSDQNYKYIFLGGSGRSGTSYMARVLRKCPNLHSFHNLELKLFSAPGGLYELYDSLVLKYSYGRAKNAISRFSKLFDQVCEGFFGHKALKDYISLNKLDEIKHHFIRSLHGQECPLRMSEPDFFRAANLLITQLADGRTGCKELERNNYFFLEKTPHNLLEISFLEKSFPKSIYIHVMRDPRSIVMSLSRMKWGPRTLEGCIEWMKNYLSVWDEIRKDPFIGDVNLTEFYIEDLAREPNTYLRILRERTGLTISDNLLEDIDLERLNQWSRQIEQDAFQKITAQLADEIKLLGYSLEHVGERL